MTAQQDGHSVSDQIGLFQLNLKFSLYNISVPKLWIILIPVLFKLCRMKNKCVLSLTEPLTVFTAACSFSIRS